MRRPPGRTKDVGAGRAAHRRLYGARGSGHSCSPPFPFSLLNPLDFFTCR